LQYRLIDEIVKYYAKLNLIKNLSIAETYNAIKDWYTGYRFSTDETN